MRMKIRHKAALILAVALLAAVPVASIGTAHAQTWEVDVGLAYGEAYAVFTVTLSEPFTTDPSEDNFSLVFDSDDDGVTNRLVSYHARLSSHYPNDYWGMKDEEPWDTDPGTPEPCGPLWHDNWQAVPSGWQVSDTDRQVFTVSVPYGYLGGPGSDFRYAVWGYKHSLDESDDDPEGSIFGCWVDSSSYYTGTVPSMPVADGPPAAPTNLIATGVSDTQINLSWQSNSDNELGFRIERKNRPKGYFHEVDAVGAGVESYSDTDVQAGETYYYRVRAWNFTQGLLGPEETFSDFTNEDDAVASSGGGGCFIATAAYGSYLDRHVNALRSFRDGYLEDAFVSAYYSVSPAIAEFIYASPSLKAPVRAALLPSVAVSQSAVGMSLAAKAMLALSLALVTVLGAVWLSRKRASALA